MPKKNLISRRRRKRNALTWPFIQLWRSAFRSYRNVSSVRWLLLGIGVGVFAGLGAVAFFYGIEILKHLFLNTFAGLSLPAPAGEAMFHGHEPEVSRPWLVPVMMCATGLLTGYLVNRFIPDSVHGGTDGTDAMINAFHNKGGVIKPMVPVIKGITSVLTIATGGSAGREGPISQIGAGIGSWLAMKLKLSAKERRILLLAGAAGGLGAIFRAPMGGALTAVEVIYLEDFEAEAVLPAVLSSVVAYTIFTLFFGTSPMFQIPDFSFSDVRELPFYLLLALFCALTGWIYVRVFYGVKYSVFHRLNAKIGIMWTTGLGGLGMGCLGIAFPQVLTGGYGWLEQAILGNLTITMMLGIILGKILATSLTIGSGMSGGMFAPALFVGGMSGGVVGYAAHDYYPDIVTQPGGYVLVGMAAFFAGVANAPIGPLLMVCELTKGYGLLAPLMLSSALCLVLNRKFSLYEYQVDNKFESPAHIGDKNINILEGLLVADVYHPGMATILEEGTSFKALVDVISGTNEFSFPVVNDKRELTGIVAVHDVRKILFEDALHDILVVRDLARQPIYVRPDYDLYAALMKFIGTDLEQIPVIDVDGEIVGTLQRVSVFQAYSDTVKEFTEDEK